MKDEITPRDIERAEYMKWQEWETLDERYGFHGHPALAAIIHIIGKIEREVRIYFARSAIQKDEIEYCREAQLRAETANKIWDNALGDIVIETGNTVKSALHQLNENETFEEFNSAISEWIAAYCHLDALKMHYEKQQADKTFNKAVDSVFTDPTEKTIPHDPNSKIIEPAPRTKQKPYKKPKLKISGSKKKRKKQK